MKATWMPPGTTIFYQFSTTDSNTKHYKKNILSRYVPGIAGLSLSDCKIFWTS